MSINYVKTAKLAVVVLLFGAVPNMIVATDKTITQVEILGTDLPQFEQIFIMPFTSGPLRDVQEAPGVTLNGIQDYAVTEQMAGRWKPGQPLIYNLKKPIVVNVTTHNPELIVSIKKLDGTGDLWTFEDKDIEKFGESNVLKVNTNRGKLNAGIASSK